MTAPKTRKAKRKDAEDAEFRKEEILICFFRVPRRPLRFIPINYPWRGWGNIASTVCASWSER